MNYFAHGRPFLDDPYFVAGTAVPDWLNVVDRRVRVRSKHAQPWTTHSDGPLAAVARGIVRHHADDHWFHETAAFAELSWKFTVMIRDHLAPDPGLRPSFLGHILVEILLDATLIQDDPRQLEAYYDVLRGLDAGVVAAAVNRMAPRTASRLDEFVARFASEPFLWDYLEDRRLCRRLDQVLRRVGLAGLPPDFAELLPEARRYVAERKDDLLHQSDPETNSPAASPEEKHA